MRTEDILDIHRDLCSQAQELMCRKQADYTNGTDDPFRNFQLGPSMGVGTIPSGIFIRFLDKVSRLATFIHKGKFQVNESLQDTVVDGINYLVLLQASVILEERRKSPHDARQIPQVDVRSSLEHNHSDGDLCLSRHGRDYDSRGDRA